MTPRPPMSTLFPYTTLFRSEGESAERGAAPVRERVLVAMSGGVDSSVAAATSRPERAPRSEEHTSELQSLRHLVCRLLLEKKKKPTPAPPARPKMPHSSTCP